MFSCFFSLLRVQIRPSQCLACQSAGRISSSDNHRPGICPPSPADATNPRKPPNKRPPGVRVRRAEAARLSHAKTKPVFGFHGNSQPPQRKHWDELPLHRRRCENTQHATPPPVCGLRATARTGHVCREENGHTCTRTGARARWEGRKAGSWLGSRDHLQSHQLRNDSPS